jgi:hypothetical protein
MTPAGRAFTRRSRASLVVTFLLLTIVLALLARAADLPDFPALQAHGGETQLKMRESFVLILAKPS